MIVDSVQRWSAGRASYRPAGEPIATRLFEVAEINSDKTARAYVLANHYSKSYPAARFRFGLYRGAELVGVAVFSVPAGGEKVLACLPGTLDERVELGRLVLDDSVPANGESWFIARTFELLRGHGLAGVLSFADPEARRTADGGMIFPGHIGTIYQATNGIYLGRGTVRTLHVLPDGSVFSARAQQKIRAGERGWRYATELLERHGAAPLTDFEARREWMREQLPRVTTLMRHRGNHRYAWALNRRDRKHLPPSLTYPKIGRAA